MTDQDDYAKRYRDNLVEAVNDLHQTEQLIFFKVVNIAMSNEYRELDETFETGDNFHFELAHFEDSNDTNVNLLLDLLKTVSETKESIMNINAIADEEIETENDDESENEESEDASANELPEVLNQEQKIQYELINQILWAVWDPYGIHDIEGSLQTYQETSWQLFKLKNSEADVEELVNVLTNEEQKALGEAATYSNCKKVAGIIYAL